MLSSPLIFLCKAFLCVTLFYSERITEKEEYFCVILTNVLPEIPFRARMQVELTGLCFTLTIPVPLSQPIWQKDRRWLYGQYLQSSTFSKWPGYKPHGFFTSRWLADLTLQRAKTMTVLKGCSRLLTLRKVESITGNW